MKPYIFTSCDKLDQVRIGKKNTTKKTELDVKYLSNCINKHTHHSPVGAPTLRHFSDANSISKKPCFVKTKPYLSAIDFLG